MRVAVVHDWLTGMRGGERVLESLLTLFDDAEIFTLLHVPGSVSPKIEARRIHTSFLDRLPFPRNRYRQLLPAFPAAIERFDLRGFDLIVSSSHCVAKGAIAPAGVPHLCYCHTPMRYVWDQYDNYFAPGRASPAVRLGMRFAASRLRRWDTETATRPTIVLANSSHVRDRVNRYWRRDATVVYPPVDVDRFQASSQRENFYLAVSALVPYKRLDVAVEAFAKSGRRLIVVGDGPEYDRLARLNGRCTEFTGRLEDDEVAELMSRCRAFVMPGEEDFGIAAVEAQAAGAPVIALGRGGALETVIGVSGPRSIERVSDDAAGCPATGVFFDEPTPASLLQAVTAFESLSFDDAALRANAQRFHRDRFLSEMTAWLCNLHAA